MIAPPLIWALPFALILLSMAVFPLIAPNWWGKKYAWVVLPLGLLVVIYYSAFFGHGERMIQTARDYVSFIILIGSLFVVAGGIHIGMFGELTPKQNVVLLAVGALLANVVGTTGASVILIRPYLRGNQWRFAPFHIVFFIFIVANCGGALTPVGDPPLFLGYLKGVPFFWVITHVWYRWLIAIALLLMIFYGLDKRHYRKQSLVEQEMAAAPDVFTLEGKRNLLFLAVILAAVLLGALLPDNLVWMRDVMMVIAAVGSYLATPKIIHAKNGFDFRPICEVAVLFAAIFAAMVPALDWLSANASLLGLNTSSGFYWATGITSSVLDNAPSYLNFLAAALGRDGVSLNDRVQVAQWISTHAALLRSISVSAVFFGAATYIGNGPNLMVKAICDHAGVKTPSFVEYIYKYTLPFLLPILIITYFMVR